MAVGLMSSDSQAGIEQQYASISPRRKKTTVIWRRLEVWILDFEKFVHVFQGGRSRSWGPNREA